LNHSNESSQPQHSAPSTQYSVVNRNIRDASIFVDELIRAGLKHVCIAPGSRHTPLVLAFAEQHEHIKIYSHLDERSMGFFALGLALALDEPVALVCTSGTAGANFYPAIIEAHQSRVPLLILTADRPHELRHSGANQTIDQIKLFGDYALWFVDMGLPESNPSAVAIRNLRTTAARTIAKANGIRKGVVHINFPFRKPLEPTPVEGDMLEIPEAAISKADHQPYTTMIRAVNQPENDALINLLADVSAQYENGIIVCGTRTVRGDDPQAVETVSALSKYMGYPILSDAVSGVRFSGVNTISSYDTFLMRDSGLNQPEVVIQLGNVPTSKWLNAYLVKSNPAYYIHIASDGEWADDAHLVTHHISYDLSNPLPEAWRNANERDAALNTQYAALEQTTWETITHEIENGAYFDGAAVYDTVDLIPDESTLFVGNSLPVRHLDQFGMPQNKRIYAYANRGASGIDGNISTALGAGAAKPDQPLVAVLGDITFYHDMNGLLAVRRCGIPITIVLLNNDGGGIFHRLPIKDYDPAFTDYFITAHGLDFSHAAKLYGLDYVQVTQRDDFRAVLKKSVENRQSTIIEVRTNAQQDLQRRAEIVAAVFEQLKRK